MSSTESQDLLVDPHQLVADAERALPDLLDDLQELIECESPSSDVEAVARSARVVRSVLLRRLGEDAETLERGGVAHVRRRPAAPRVMLLGHHDTVWPLGTLADIPFAVRDGVITGPGCFDMLVGVVQAVHALALLKKQLGPDALDHVELLVTGDEELGSPTSRDLIMADARGCEAVLVLEASADGGAPKIARKGASMYVIDVIGRAAHAGLEPAKGINAGLAVAHLAIAIDRLGDSELGTTVTPTAMTAGTTTNTIPAAARLHVDARAWTADEQDRVDRDIRALVAQIPGAELVVNGGPDRPPLEETSSRRLMQRWLAAGAALGAEPIPGVAVGGASDGNFTAGLGVPTLDGLGAVGGGAHARSEHALVGPIPVLTAQLALLVADLLSAPPGTL
jgi:glutamate carboxypeptidase